MKLSNRLQLVADFVTKGNVMADIGTDHGYVPVYLVKNNLIPKAFAMDIGKGPLERAEEHVLEYGVADKVELRLSDGLAKLNEGEADTVLIAGMGGGLIVDILEKGKNILSQVKEIILSPHSEWELVREYMVNEGYIIIREEMIIDSGKYYVVMKWQKKDENFSGKEYTKEELVYGRLLLANKDEILNEYLLKEKENYQKILKSLETYGKDNSKRKQEIEECIEVLNKALEAYM